MYFTSKKSFLVEQNHDGTLLITKTSTMKPLENAGSFIISQGGIEAILSKCKEVTDEEFLEDRKQLRLRNVRTGATRDWQHWDDLEDWLCEEYGVKELKGLVMDALPKHGGWVATEFNCH